MKSMTTTEARATSNVELTAAFQEYEKRRHYGTPDARSIRKALDVLTDNGIPKDEAPTVLQAVGYALLDTELF